MPSSSSSSSAASGSASESTKDDRNRDTYIEWLDKKVDEVAKGEIHAALDGDGEPAAKRPKLNDDVKRVITDFLDVKAPMILPAAEAEKSLLSSFKTNKEVLSMVKKANAGLK